MNAKSDVKKIVKDIDDEAQEAESTGARVLRELKEKTSGLQEKAVNFQHDATEYVKENYSKVKDKTVNAGEKVTDYAKENPIKTIGISVAVGAVLAKLLRSRK